MTITARAARMSASEHGNSDAVSVDILRDLGKLGRRMLLPAFLPQKYAYALQDTARAQVGCLLAVVAPVRVHSVV